MDTTTQGTPKDSRPQRLLHVPACGVRVVISLGASIVIDPGPDERSRRRRLVLAAISSALIGIAFAIGVATAPLAAVSGDLWMPLAVLGLAVVGRILRPPCRTIPHALLPDLGWLHSIDRADHAQAHHLVWATVTTGAQPGDAVVPDAAQLSRWADDDA